jgi:hypothetical protein
MSFDFTDFYILYQGQPKYDSTELIEDELIRVIVQKYQMIIFTNKGEVLGDPDFGANLEQILFEFRVSEDYVKAKIQEQIDTYIPEMLGSAYNLQIVFVQDPENYQDMMFVNLTIADYDIVAQIGRIG